MQLRLLQFGVQAAPPIKDTGNDLVAFRRRTVRTLQVKTSTRRISQDRRLPEHYEILALVSLHNYEGVVALDVSRVFLIPQALVMDTRRNFRSLAHYELRHDDVNHSMRLLEYLFGPDAF
ncbi:hypothetical protein [Pseudoxanthomonas sp.]|uniref:hypothetical protein n=1 Tax=Pseudoxanthomonas sp. TaxID=1871049 RepID=UPI003F7EE391